MLSQLIRLPIYQRKRKFEVYYATPVAFDRLKWTEKAYLNIDLEKNIIWILNYDIIR